MFMALIHPPTPPSPPTHTALHGGNRDIYLNMSNYLSCSESLTYNRMMENSQNPFGLHTITPYIIVKDVHRLIDFLVDVFSGKQRGEITYRDDKTIQHAEVKVGDSIIMLGEPSTQVSAFGPMTCGMYVYVDDCKKVYEKALACGATSISSPRYHSHGDMYAEIKDVTGNIWWIVTHVGKQSN